jgi:mRNA degradation ribonuclease J1/J2
MATTSTLRLRRNAAQLHALAEVERTIRATDPNSRRKYLREFTEAFQSYHSVLNAAQVRERLTSSSIVLVGDYHALPSS